MTITLTRSLKMDGAARPRLRQGISGTEIGLTISKRLMNELEGDPS